MNNNSDQLKREFAARIVAMLVKQRAKLRQVKSFYKMMGGKDRPAGSETESKMEMQEDIYRL